MRIKGNFLKDYVETVLKTPELDWAKYLNPEDWEIIKGIIIPSAWYPVETMGRIGRGLFEMRIGSNYALLREHGKMRFSMFDSETQKFLTKNDPIAAIQAFLMIMRRYVDGLSITLEKFQTGTAEISFYPVDEAPSWDLFREIQAGTIQKIIELNGGKTPQGNFRSETRKGHTADILHLSWS